jgi:hypothetical protein
MADSTPRLLLPIRLVTLEVEIRGHVSSGDKRITDILQRGDLFRVLPLGASPDPGSWLEISPSEIQIVVPPPLVSPPERRLARQERTVFVRAGDYELTGTAHLAPGSEHDVLSRSSHPFLPLTAVTLVAPGAEEPEALDVAIVNLHLTSEYRVV